MTDGTLTVPTASYQPRPETPLSKAVQLPCIPFQYQLKPDVPLKKEEKKKKKSQQKSCLSIVNESQDSRQHHHHGKNPDTEQEGVLSNYEFTVPG